MPRFNLICHGMMLFVEEGNFVRILIPHVPEHDYQYGTPAAVAGKCKGNLAPLPTGTFQLTGPLPHGEAVKEMLSPKDHLIVRRSHADPVPANAPRHLRIPKSRLIRGFRPVELLDRDIFKTTPKSVAADTPRLLHDAVAFCYSGLPDGTLIEIPGLFKVTLTGIGATLCIYAQAPAELPGGGWHPTAVNDLLSLKVAPGGKPDFDLSRVGTADGAPDLDPLATAIEMCQVRNLIELNTDKDRTDRTGCTGAFLVD